MGSKLPVRIILSQDRKERPRIQSPSICSRPLLLEETFRLNDEPRRDSCGARGLAKGRNHCTEPDSVR